MNNPKVESESAGQALEELKNTVARLRAPEGCPWDRTQTHESLKAACVLGDLLLQVMMHSQIAEEEGFFTLTDVIRGINEKMIRRHPHVFGPTTNNKTDPGTIPADWKKIKAMEKKGREWEEAYLFEAFDEAEKLIAVARERKKQNSSIEKID